jgi:hypothetical protein
MFSKTRTTVTAAVATLTFAIAGVAPAISQADMKEAGTHAATCEVYRLTYGLLKEAEEAAERNGQRDLAVYYEQKMDSTFASAETANCAWVLPQVVTLKTVVPPVAVVKASTPPAAKAPVTTTPSSTVASTKTGSAALPLG